MTSSHILLGYDFREYILLEYIYIQRNVKKSVETSQQ